MKLLLYILEMIFSYIYLALMFVGKCFGAIPGFVWDGAVILFLLLYIPPYLNEYRIEFGIGGSSVVWYIGYIIVVLTLYFTLVYYNWPKKE